MQTSKSYNRRLLDEQSDQGLFFFIHRLLMDHNDELSTVRFTVDESSVPTYRNQSNPFPLKIISITGNVWISLRLLYIGWSQSSILIYILGLVYTARN